MKVSVNNIYKSFHIFPALKNVTLTVPSGDLMALLGPSGSGKTTLLRVIAGLETPGSGEVEFGNNTVTHQPIQDRNVGFVFQQYALFPHMTVSQNIGFGLRVRHCVPYKIKMRVEELINLMQLRDLDDRFPSELSGGQQQRVALARALAPNPTVLLLDEPFGALDAKVRSELRHWLRHLHNEISTTTIFVTHDQDEAFEVADSIVILNNGSIEQIGSPSEIYDHPVNPFVMDFIGNNNTINGYLSGHTGYFGEIVIPQNTHFSNRIPATVCIRSQDIVLSSTSNGLPYLSGVVTDVRRIGIDMKITVSSNSTMVPLVIDMSHKQWITTGFDVGSSVVASVKNARVFPDQGKKSNAQHFYKGSYRL